VNAAVCQPSITSVHCRVSSQSYSPSARRRATWLSVARITGLRRDTGTILGTLGVSRRARLRSSRLSRRLTQDVADRAVFRSNGEVVRTLGDAGSVREVSSESAENAPSIKLRHSPVAGVAVDCGSHGTDSRRLRCSSWARRARRGTRALDVDGGRSGRGRRAIGDATVAPLQCEDSAHFSEGRVEIRRALEQAGDRRGSPMDGARNATEG